MALLNRPLSTPPCAPRWLTDSQGVVPLGRGRLTQPFWLSSPSLTFMFSFQITFLSIPVPNLSSSIILHQSGVRGGASLPLWLGPTFISFSLISSGFLLNMQMAALAFSTNPGLCKNFCNKCTMTHLFYDLDCIHPTPKAIKAIDFMTVAAAGQQDLQGISLKASLNISKNFFSYYINYVV